MKTEKKGAKQTALLLNLADDFGPTNWGGADAAVMDPDDVASMLGIDGEEVALLCATGFLKGTAVNGGLGVPRLGLIRFMEAYGEWWFRLRGQKQLERLRGAAGLKTGAASTKTTAVMFSALRDLHATVMGSKEAA